MTLTQALNTAQAIFKNTGKQSAVVSNNIANSSNADYTRRQAMTTISSDGATVVQIARSAEPSLQRQLLSSTSADAAQQRLLTGLGDIQSTIGGNDSETAPSTYLSKFREALQAYAGAPNSNTTAQAAVTAAQDVANSLNQSTADVQTIRTNADKEISTTVGTLNGLLQQFQTANDAVKSETGSGGDPNDALDQRDALLKQISSIVGVKTVNRANGDMALYTSDGATLFETIPRAVTFTPTNGYSSGSSGNGVYIDGVALAAGSGPNTTAKGTLQALLQIRDVEAPTYQKQLDEIGRSLVSTFSETNTTDGSRAAGLFTYNASVGDAPDSPTIINGIAASITVNPAVITSAGGNPNLLRDGGINGADYVTNTSGNAGYSTQLDAYDTAMGKAVDFDPSAGVDSNSSIMDFASNSVGWVESERSAASTAAENTAASSSRSTEAYSNGTGVNLDQELTLMMDIEQSYKAGTKILSAVNDMLTALLQLN